VEFLAILFGVGAVLFLVAAIIGVVKPKIVKQESRGKAFGINAITACILFFLLILVLPPAVNYEQSLSEIKEFNEEDRKEILAGYLKSNEISEEHESDFYNCMSDMVQSKSGKLSIGEVLGWCKEEFLRNGNSFINVYVNYENLENQFSQWNGAHKELERIILESMNDPDSYEHVETRYRVIKDSGNSHLLLTTQFRGKNSFGGVVRQEVVAKANLNTGSIIEVLMQ